MTYATPLTATQVLAAQSEAQSIAFSAAAANITQIQQQASLPQTPLLELCK